MAMKCTVCMHPKVKEIEKLIVQDKPHTAIADQFGLNNQAVRYHSIHHLPDKLVRAVQKSETVHAESILSGIQKLLKRTERIMHHAESKGSSRLELEAIREARGTYELLSKIAVKLREYQEHEKRQEHDESRAIIQEGYKALTDTELKTYIQLQAKILAADENYDLDPEVSRFVENAGRLFDQSSSSNRLSRYKNRQKNIEPGEEHHEAEPETNDPTDPDLSLDLDFDSLSDIASDESDPEWLRKERRQMY